MPISENQVTFLSPEGFLNTSCGLLKRFALGHNWSFSRAISCKRSNWESGVCLACPCRIHSQELCIVVHCSIFPDWIYFLVVLTCICRYKTEELGYTSKKSEGRQKDAVGGWSKDHVIHYNKFHFLFVHLPWSNSVLSLLSGCGRPVGEQNLICSAAWNHRSSLVFSAASWVGTYQCLFPKICLVLFCNAELDAGWWTKHAIHCWPAHIFQSLEQGKLVMVTARGFILLGDFELQVCGGHLEEQRWRMYGLFRSHAPEEDSCSPWRGAVAPMFYRWQGKFSSSSKHLHISGEVADRALRGKVLLLRPGKSADTAGIHWEMSTGRNKIFDLLHF